MALMRSFDGELRRGHEGRQNRETTLQNRDQQGHDERQNRETTLQARDQMLDRQLDREHNLLDRMIGVVERGNGPQVQPPVNDAAVGNGRVLIFNQESEVRGNTQGLKTRTLPGHYNQLSSPGTGKNYVHPVYFRLVAKDFVTDSGEDTRVRFEVYRNDNGNRGAKIEGLTSWTMAKYLIPHAEWTALDPAVQRAIIDSNEKREHPKLRELRERLGLPYRPNQV